MFNTELEYIGDVELFLNIGSKTIKINTHNAGTPILHQSICRFLAGQYRGLCDIPNFLDIRKNNRSILSQIVSLTGRSFRLEGNEYIVQCEAQIPYQQLIVRVDPEDTSLLDVVLCADKDPDIYSGTYRDLAYVQITAGSLSSILPGTSIAVKWTLHIKNGGSVNA